MRLEMAQEVIEVTGIRPLARELDVNPKSVYKYKEGSAHPGDQVMSKILMVAYSEDEIPLEAYFDKLRDDFLDALEIDFEDLELSETETDNAEELEKEEVETVEDETGRKEEDSEDEEGEDDKQLESVVQESTEEESEKPTVDEKSTKELGLSEVFEKIGVTKPFNQSKVEKILEALQEEPDSTIIEIVEISNLSREAVEKYLERLESEKIVTETPEGSYKLIVDFSKEA